MSQDPLNSECSALIHFSMSLARKYVHLKEPYNQDIKEQVAAIIFFKKDRFYMKSPTPETKCAEGVFQIQSPIWGINLFVFFYQGFLSRTLTTHRTAGEGKRPSFFPLYHFRPLKNIQTFICNFAFEMTITYF